MFSKGMNREKNFLVLPFLFFVFFISSIQTEGPNVWKSKVIYQIVTDRFAINTSRSVSSCSSLTSYCGGTWEGIAVYLGYITNMGFDAIWISPIIENIDNTYFGYWPKDFGNLNPHFGIDDDLINLVDKCKNQSVLVMLDIINNHAGPVGSENYSQINPFNNVTDYHDCSICHPLDCGIMDWSNDDQLLNCRITYEPGVIGLPDLDQYNEFVNDTLMNVVQYMIEGFRFDGVRLDSAAFVPNDFWHPYVNSLPVFSIADISKQPNVSLSDMFAALQNNGGPFVGVMNYPLFQVLTRVFIEESSMIDLQEFNSQFFQMFTQEEISLMGNFIENHMFHRFLSQRNNIGAYTNALAYVLLAQGIPIIYYGTEQALSDDFRSLWPDYNMDSEIYQFIKRVNEFRTTSSIWKESQVERFASNKLYAFSRGESMVFLTNLGTGSPGYILQQITNHSFNVGQRICNIFNETYDCIRVESTGFIVNISNGECKVYASYLDFTTSEITTAQATTVEVTTEMQTTSISTTSEASTQEATTISIITTSSETTTSSISTTSNIIQTTQNTSPQVQPSQNGISGGVIVGIVIGVLVTIGIFVSLAFLVKHWWARRHYYEVLS